MVSIPVSAFAFHLKIFIVTAVTLMMADKSTTSVLYDPVFLREKLITVPIVTIIFVRNLKLDWSIFRISRRDSNNPSLMQIECGS
jgi:hypothetical protein